MIKELVLKNRSYRRFYQDLDINKETLYELVELARLCPSAKNLQPLRYILSNTMGKNEAVFSCLAWAGYLKDWKGPGEGEKPSAYIIILRDAEIKPYFTEDVGIAAQSIMLGAVERELGGCIIASVNKKRLQRELDIKERYEILLVLALGKPKEQVVIEEVDSEGDIKYWRDDDGVHHVPKRKLKDIIIE